MTTSTAVRARPMQFTDDSVRAIIEGTKTQTRRVMRVQPERLWGHGVRNADRNHYCVHVRVGGVDRYLRCPYGAPGEQIWVREAWQQIDDGPPLYRQKVKGMGQPFAVAFRWKSARYMPRWASRLCVDITAVRIERLNEITTADARREGCNGGHDSVPNYAFAATPVEHYRHVWNSLHTSRGHPWESNPWVWVITFRRIDP